MARRPSFGNEPVSQLAVWSGRLALFALLVAILSVFVLRSGVLEIGPALATFGAALVFALLAILLALAAFVAIWRQGLSGLGRALLGLTLGVLLLIYPSSLAYRALRLPAISDVTTDPANPPRFDTLARLRPPGRAAYPGGSTAELQRAAYPDIVPLQINVPVRTAYEVALAVINKNKWLVVDARAPTASRRDGVIEAVARTSIMGFRDDVSIRINPLGQGARIDLRSASRYGSHDFGANAARLRGLLEEIDDAASSAPEPRPEPAAKAPAKKTVPANKR